MVLGLVLGGVGGPEGGGLVAEVVSDADVGQY